MRRSALPSTFGASVRKTVDVEVRANKGNGVHYDMDAASNTIAHNRVHHNARKGIQYELSTGGKIYGNVVWENGWATPAGTNGAGITLHNASTTEVYNNTLAWNADGIAVFALNREGTEYDLVHDVYVHDNKILAANNSNETKNNVVLAWIQGWSDTLFNAVNNNRGVNNEYWYVSPEGSSERFRWDGNAISRLLVFNLTGGEENGRYLKETEKDNIVTSKGVPPYPEQH